MREKIITVIVVLIISILNFFKSFFAKKFMTNRPVKKNEVENLTSSAPVT